MRQSRRIRRPSVAADAMPRRRGCTLAPAATVLAIALMGCSNPMLTGSRTPPPGRLTLSVADAALAAGAPDMALRVAELILQREPHDVPALVAKGDALYAMGHPDLARGAYRAAVAANPASVGALIGLGRTLVRTNPKAAEAMFLDAATRQPDNITALSNLGIARDLQGRHESAQAAYRKALAAAPDSTDVKLNLGLSLALSGKQTEAVTVLRPLADEVDAIGVRRNDLAAALALAGDQVEAGLVLRGDTRLADPEAQSATSAAIETPLVAIASPVRSPARADATVAPPMDIRPAPVVQVLEVPGVRPPNDPTPRSAGAARLDPVSASPATPATTQAVTASIAPAVERLAGRHEPMRVTLAATGLGASQAAGRAAHAADRHQPTSAAPEAPIEPASATAAIVAAPLASTTVATATIASAAIRPDALAPTAITSAAIAPETHVRATVTRIGPSHHTAGLFAQLAALDTEQRARVEWQRLQTRMPGLLAGRAPEIVQAEVRGRTFWRLRTTGFRSANEQNAFCSQVRGFGVDCW
jgi:Flp pilus assembly protein TadD